MTIDYGKREDAIVLADGKGRRYDMPGMTAVFKTDGPETADTYSISEWCLEAGATGPGKHSHEANDDVFYMLEGTLTFWLADRWVEATKGAFVRVPAGVEHDYENRTSERARMLNLFIPGGFEDHMPGIVQWFADNPPAAKD